MGLSNQGETRKLPAAQVQALATGASSHGCDRHDSSRHRLGATAAPRTSAGAPHASAGAPYALAGAPCALAGATRDDYVYSVRMIMCSMSVYTLTPIAGMHVLQQNQIKLPNKAPLMQVNRRWRGRHGHTYTFTKNHVHDHLQHRLTTNVVI